VQEEPSPGTFGGPLPERHVAAHQVDLRLEGEEWVAHSGFGLFRKDVLPLGGTHGGTSAQDSGQCQPAELRERALVAGRLPGGFECIEIAQSFVWKALSDQSRIVSPASGLLFRVHQDRLAAPTQRRGTLAPMQFRLRDAGNEWMGFNADGMAPR